MNNVNLIGRICNNIELKVSNGGKSYTVFTLAVTRDKDNTDFINCMAWNKISEILFKYCKKGARIGIRGEIRVSKTDKNFYTSILVNNLYLLENKEESKKETQSIGEQERILKEFEELDEIDDDKDLDFPF